MFYHHSNSNLSGKHPVYLWEMSSHQGATAIYLGVATFGPSGNRYWRQTDTLPHQSGLHGILPFQCSMTTRILTGSEDPTSAGSTTACTRDYRSTSTPRNIRMVITAGGRDKQFANKSKQFISIDCDPHWKVPPLHDWRSVFVWFRVVTSYFSAPSKGMHSGCCLTRGLDTTLRNSRRATISRKMSSSKGWKQI